MKGLCHLHHSLSSLGATACDFIYLGSYIGNGRNYHLFLSFWEVKIISCRSSLWEIGPFELRNYRSISDQKGRGGEKVTCDSKSSAILFTNGVY